MLNTCKTLKGNTRKIPKQWWHNNASAMLSSTKQFYYYKCLPVLLFQSRYKCPSFVKFVCDIKQFGFMTVNERKRLPLDDMLY